ncbi:hypothetical protein CHLNCDRAFT_137806 [Chlorella variabilis]|uniref:Thioredoxin domain-containing protein n=1 Tax=Chlorella variabilis TaxID=554065 RepID=E1Z4J3_CHLVA|nr:hypothetical protein CHLNCDRAFT_137806 [Chlorella variabilis]EFN59355.1 hypothetical protein CHLNCDRAFT_137806 [Chlorella variabilis]|eukprot:XP_005851457.1 hypothetical protein CHLNCDRAFT_137806 [Chlorella variabilis]
MQAPQLVTPTPLADAAALADALQRDRLQVVELYADWAGPTQALPTFWRKVAMEHGGQLPLDLSTACYEKCHDAPALAGHSSTSQPKFLLFKGGKQVACVEGVDPPGLLAAVNKQLAAASGAAAAHRSSDSEEE